MGFGLYPGIPPRCAQWRNSKADGTGGAIALGVTKKQAAERLAVLSVYSNARSNFDRDRFEVIVGENRMTARTIGVGVDEAAAWADAAKHLRAIGAL